MATRWACLGAGKIADDFFKAIRGNLPAEEHAFVAIGSSSLERAQAFADKFKFARAYGSYDEVANDSEVEVVYISTVNSNHASLSIKMLEAGKHVLCEKPMAMNEKQVREVFAVAKQHNRFFSEGMWSRCMPLYDVIRKELTKDTLGEIRIIQADLTAPKDIDGSWFMSMSQCGGALLCIGLYTIQFAMLVCNEMPEKIVAVGNLAPTGVDEKAAIILQYKSGALASLSYGFRTAVGKRTATILGSKDRIDVDAPFHSPTKVTTPSGEFVREVKDENYFYANSDAFKFEADTVRRCIQKGEIENNYWTMDDTVLMYKIMDEIRLQLGLKYPDEDQ